MDKMINLPRCFVSICYPESFDIIRFTDWLSAHGASYFYVLHDRDLDETGHPKKPHWHIFVRLTVTLRYSESICPPTNLIRRPRKGEVKNLQYFMHSDISSQEKGKTPYDFEEIVSNYDPDEMNQFLFSEDDDEKVARVRSTMRDLFPLCNGDMTVEEFLYRNPEWLYKMGQLRELIRFTCGEAQNYKPKF